MYSHKYLDDENYFGNIYVKTNIVENLEKELRSKSWKREIVNAGGITDNYQPAEAGYKLMPDILKLLIKYRTPAIISTKSDLILRDYDLIDQLSRITYVNIATTITTMDENVRKLIEPNGSPSEKRFGMLREFSKTNASIGVHVMPVIPFITDTEENLNGIFSAAKDARADYLLPGTLYLRGNTRKYFFDFVSKSYPDAYKKLKTLYKTGSAGKEYKNYLYAIINRLRADYGLSGNYSKQIKEKINHGQLSLFDDM